MRTSTFTHLYRCSASPIMARLSRVCRCACSTRLVRGARAKKAWTWSCTRSHSSASDFELATPSLAACVCVCRLADVVWADALSPACITFVLACESAVYCVARRRVGRLICTAAARHRLGTDRIHKLRRRVDSMGALKERWCPLVHIPRRVTAAGGADAFNSITSKTTTSWIVR